MRAILFFLTAAMLSSCASVPRPPKQAVDSATRTELMMARQNWRFQGRVAYSHLGKGGSAQIIWLQKAEVSDIRITAPLAIGTAHIVLTPDSAQFVDSKGNVVAEGDPETVFLQVLQTPVPNQGFVNGLRAFWPDNPELTASALTGQVIIDQWQWRYLEWQDSPIYLPKQIEIEHVETRVRILIDSWQELPDG